MSENPHRIRLDKLLADRAAGKKVWDLVIESAANGADEWDRRRGIAANPHHTTIKILLADRAAGKRVSDGDIRRAENTAAEWDRRYLKDFKENMAALIQAILDHKC